ncbi:DUF5990 family protein [Methylobacterium soli]|uniref:Uncharacterized protein n=1 Tax=Methylobacterium soli TaxID=553447 RepID=A0A6L3STE7_9HYPH|nr:DUF5990 family protein [Methylobacterium soli]KAB1076867.1 hypothetical protein F6X53_21645 [Methylobacterium soli]GJE45500.1 hypothetical protein AEGHOMDF_4696 [Methylobacterium soli]
MAEGQVITLRLRILDPLPGVAYSLQNRKSEPVGQVTAGNGPIAFDVPVRVAPGPRLAGDFVRREGAGRCFVYIAIGEQAGQHPSAWSRRAKVDIPALSAALLDQALAGAVLEAELPGRAKDGGPACATLHPIAGWQPVA